MIPRDKAAITSALVLGEDRQASFPLPSKATQRNDTLVSRCRSASRFTLCIRSTHFPFHRLEIDDLEYDRSSSILAVA